MKLIKTRTRNQLEEATLDDLMLISLVGPDLRGLDLVRYVENWKSGKKRYFY